MKLNDKATSIFKKTRQGYLVTRATIARTGKLEYRGSEFDEGTREKYKLDKNKMYDVFITAEELFRDETIKSFEGMPITIHHPDDLEVVADDWRDKAVGHIQNIRAEGDELVGDSYIQDAAAIAYIEKTGVRETSIGQDANITMVDGKLYKVNLIGNHVAVVPSGRAGTTKLGDRKPKMTLAQKIAKVIGKRKTKLADSKAATLKQRLTDAGEELAKLDEAETPEEKAEAVAEVIASVVEVLDEAQALQEEVVDDVPAEKITDAEGEGDEALREERDNLRVENEELKSEIDDLKARIDELEGKEETENVINDAKARKITSKLNDAMSPIEAKRTVLVDAGTFDAKRAKAMDANQINAAYAAFLATRTPRNTVGSSILNDSKPATSKPASQRLGGK